MTLGILIIFDDPTATYIGGQEVTGHAIIGVDKEKKIYGIAIEFRGETQVHVGGEGRTREVYFLEKSFLQEARQVLIRGSHFYPFSFVLPRSLPSSFEDASYGHVRYTVKVYVLGKWRKKLESTVSRFTVVTPLDLNLICVQEPLTLVKHGHRTRWLCWRSKPHILVGKLPCTRFVPGDEVEVMVGFKNPTDTCMSVICEFIKKVVFFTDSVRAECRSVKTVLGRHVLGSALKSYAAWNTRFRVPQLPPSCLEHCKYIDVTYFIEIKASAEMVISAPIVIGTIPLRTTPARRPSGVASPLPLVTTNLSPPAGATAATSATGGGADISAASNALERVDSLSNVDEHSASSDALERAEDLIPSAPREPVSSDPEDAPPPYEECALGYLKVRDEDDSES